MSASSASRVVSRAMTLAELKYDDRGLLTVVAQDRLTGELRMLAHANREALQATLDTGVAHFYSRSRGALWKKGESSGHVLRVSEVWTDCDGDADIFNKGHIVAGNEAIQKELVAVLKRAGKT